MSEIADENEMKDEGDDPEVFSTTEMGDSTAEALMHKWQKPLFLISS